jgi:uncharacterized repeat protein (TIGR04138 family)
MIDKDQVILDLVQRDGRYRSEAYHFIFEALDLTLQTRGGGRRHVSGEEILFGVRRLALESFGYLARSVLENWGVSSTSDFGEIVFNLISIDLLQKTADDRLEDFVGLYSFDEAFDHAFEQELAAVDI